MASLFLKLGLINLALVSVFVAVFGTPTALKRALNDSGVYNNVTDNVINLSEQEGTDKEPGSNMSLAAPQIKQAATTAFGPDLIRQSTEQIIDGTYSWLLGKTEKPDFKIDLSQAKLRFATAAGDNAAARARQLPACSLQQTRELAANGGADPFSLPCYPPGVDVSLVKNKVISDLANNDNFLKDPVITADSLPRDQQGKPLHETFSNAPQIFQWLLRAPLIIGGLTLIAGLLLITLHRDKRKGFRSVSITMLGSGIFLLAITWIFGLIVGQAIQSTGNMQTMVLNGMGNNYLEIVRALTKVLSNKLMVFGLAYGGLGIVLLLILRIYKPKPSVPEPQPYSEGLPSEATAQNNSSQTLDKPPQ